MSQGGYDPHKKSLSCTIYIVVDFCTTVASKHALFYFRVAIALPSTAVEIVSGTMFCYAMFYDITMLSYPTQCYAMLFHAVFCHIPCNGMIYRFDNSYTYKELLNI